MGTCCTCDVEKIDRTTGAVDVYRTTISSTGISIKKVNLPPDPRTIAWIERWILDVNRDNQADPVNLII